MSQFVVDLPGVGSGTQDNIEGELNIKAEKVLAILAPAYTHGFTPYALCLQVRGAGTVPYAQGHGYDHVQM